MNRQGMAIFAVAGFIVVAVTGVLLRPLLPVDETRYVAVAWEMWQSGDYLVPTKNYAIYTDKPPLLFWTINLIWAVTGVSEISARLAGPFYAVLTLLLTGLLARRLWPQEEGAGGRAVIALAGMLAFVVLGGTTMFDAMLAAATVGGMLALVEAGRGGALRWWLLLGAAIAAGVLSKGPVILLHLLPAMLALPFWAGPAPDGRLPLRRLALGIAAALATALALVALWLLPAIVSGGAEYRDAILWNQSAGRISQSFAHPRPWWFFIALLPVLLFPWGWSPTFWRAARAVSWSEPGLRLTLVWTGSALLLFSLISGKQIHYLLPELPAVALMVARFTADGRRLRLHWAAVPVVLLALLAVAAAAGILPIESIRRLFEPRSVLLAAALLLAALSWYAAQTGGLRGGVVLSLGVMLSFNLLVGLSGAGSLYDAGRIAAAIAPADTRGIAFYGQSYHAEFNFAGRLRQPVALPQTLPELRAWAAANPEGLIVSRPDRTAPDWLPAQTIQYRNTSYGIWRAADASRQEPAS